MKLIRTVDAAGQVLCHDITQIIPGEYKDARFRKGHVIQPEDIPVLLSIGKENLYVWEKHPGILHEDEAAALLYKAAAGKNIHGTAPKEGKIELIADCDGLLKINRKALMAVNSTPQMMIATIHGDLPVKKGQKLAGTRIIPLVIEQEKMDAMQAAAGAEPILNVLPMQAKKVGIITTGSEVFKGRIEDKFTPILQSKLAVYGCEMVFHKVCDDDPAGITAAILEAKAAGCELIFTTGGMSVDPDDRTPLAIKNTGADIISYGAPVLKCLHAAMPDVYYDVHLMISDPARYAADFARAGASLITFHLEAVPDTAEEVIAAIRAAGCQVGISIRPGTPVEAVFPYLGVVDLILVMSVEPGFGGQKFIPTTPTRIAAICAERTRRGCDTLIEVDGGINTETGPLCIAAGADWLVAGSSLFHAMDPAAVVNVLHSK